MTESQLQQIIFDLKSLNNQLSLIIENLTVILKKLESVFSTLCNAPFNGEENARMRQVKIRKIEFLINTIYHLRKRIDLQMRMSDVYCDELKRLLSRMEEWHPRYIVNQQGGHLILMHTNRCKELSVDIENILKKNMQCFESMNDLNTTEIRSIIKAYYRISTKMVAIYHNAYLDFQEMQEIIL